MMFLRIVLYVFLLHLIPAAYPLRAQVAVYTPDPLVKMDAEGGWRTSRPPGLRLVAPRNGTATAPAVVTGVSTPPAAQVTALNPISGGAPFPASNLRIRYGWEGLNEKPDSGGGPHAIWLTAEVPPETRPGVYRGMLNLSGAGGIPIQLEVGEWLAPRPNDYRTWQSYLHSAETVAKQYRATPWSDAHFEKIESSLRLMGQLGTHVMYVPVTAQDQPGIEHGMIRWTGSGPAARPEFSALERFFQLWGRHLGPPRIIIVQMHFASMWTHRERHGSVTVTETSARGGPGGRQVEWPPFYAPGQGAVWRQAFQGLQERVTAMGWSDTSIMIGMNADSRDFPDDILAFYREAAPGLRWAMFTHGRGDPRIPDEAETPYVISGVDFGYVEYPYSPNRGRALPSDPLERTPQSPEGFPFLTTLREGHVDGVGRITTMEPSYWMFKAMASVFNTNGYRGFGHIGLDYWPVSDGGEPLLRRNNLTRDNTRWMSQPGPDGAVSSPAIEFARMGNAANEAMHVLHTALRQGGLNRALREEAEAAFNDVYAILSTHWLGNRQGLHDSLSKVPDTPWRDAFRQLFDVTGRVAAAADLVADVGGLPPPGPQYRAADARDWTSREGQTLTGVFVEYAPGQVTLLLPDHRQVAVPLERLSPEDEAWVREKTGMRIWRNQQGAEVEARLLEATPEGVHLERADGRTFTLDTGILSEADQAYLRSRPQ
ncbi:MAG: hypothetical protein LAT79_09185 [Kiritimatiellae bacterium]|nr:hypothetical protein [Kiritimatiellia bacterium]